MKNEKHVGANNDYGSCSHFISIICYMYITPRTQLSQMDIAKRVKPSYLIPMNGDCLWSCFAVSRNPHLSKEVLKPEAFHLRFRGVGATIDRVGVMGEDHLAMVQSVIAPKEGEPQTREEILEELKKYMHSGIWSGDMGDLMPQAAASSLSQGLIIIHPTERPYCTYAAPDCEMFRGKEDTPYPCIVVQHGKHFETVLIHKDSKESARNLLERLKVEKFLQLNLL